MDSKNRVKVTIMGEEYILKGSSSPETMVRVGYYVDRIMRNLTDTNNHMSSHKIAVLAALNIADELFKLKTMGHDADNKLKGQDK